jgi:hypothetical protein
MTHSLKNHQLLSCIKSTIRKPAVLLRCARILDRLFAGQSLHDCTRTIAGDHRLHCNRHGPWVFFFARNPVRVNLNLLFGEKKMRRFGCRTIALFLLAAVAAGVSSAARADGGVIRISVLKGGWFIGASGGSGTLTFHGRTYPLSIGGIDAGLVFGASQSYLAGTVTNIYRPSDVAGVYGAGGAGAAVGRGVRAIVLSNEKGAVLQLSGRQTGLMLNADLSGLAISLR